MSRLGHEWRTPLLRFYPVPLGLLRKFRAACKKEGVTLLETLLNFIEVYGSETQE